MSVAPQNDGYHACSMAYHDCSLRHQWRRYYHDWYQRTGDELRFSPGFWTDLWALFSMEVRLASIIGAYFVFEIVYVFAFACFLWLIGGVKPTSFTRCTLASARTVTMLGNWEPKQFDFVGGGEEAVSAAGAALLMFQGWLHFMYVCVASSLVIVRALRPLQQVAFSHHACLTDEEFTLRIRVLRPRTTVLICPHVRIDVCLNSGTFVELDLHGGGKYAKWSGNPTITIRHKLSEGTPFFLKRAPPTAEEAAAGQEGKIVSTLDDCACVSCSFVATDANGTAVSEVQQYTPNTAGFARDTMMKRYVQAGCTQESALPQVLHHCKFEDQLRLGTATAAELAAGNSGTGQAWARVRALHPHGTPSNIELRRDGGKGGVMAGVKRLVTNSDTFCRIAAADSTIGQRSSSHNRSTKEAADAEKRQEERRQRRASASAAGQSDK